MESFLPWIPSKTLFVKVKFPETEGFNLNCGFSFKTVSIVYLWLIMMDYGLIDD